MISVEKKESSSYLISLSPNSSLVGIYSVIFLASITLVCGGIATIFYFFGAALILPFAGMGVSKGGIQLLQNTIDRETLATVCAYVVKMGPSCYKDAKFEGESWCKEKQWVLIGRYAGAKFKLGDDAECRIINDDEVIATIHDPTDIVAI